MIVFKGLIHVKWCRLFNPTSLKMTHIMITKKSRKLFLHSIQNKNTCFNPRSLYSYLKYIAHFLISGFPADLENVVSKILPKLITLLGIIKQDLQCYFFSIRQVIILNIRFSFFIVLWLNLTMENQGKRRN